MCISSHSIFKFLGHASYILHQTLLHMKSLVTSKVLSCHLLEKCDTFVRICIYRGFQNLPNSSNNSDIGENEEYHENGAKIGVKMSEILKRGQTDLIKLGRARPLPESHARGGPGEARTPALSHAGRWLELGHARRRPALGRAGC